MDETRPCCPYHQTLTIQICQTARQHAGSSHDVVASDDAAVCDQGVRMYSLPGQQPLLDVLSELLERALACLAGTPSPQFTCLCQEQPARTPSFVSREDSATTQE